VELHGGRIEAHSTGIGRGSEFVVTLPLSTRAGVSHQRSEHAAAPPLVSRRVLIADDNRDAADTLALLLELDGHQVTVVHDGRAAIAAFDTTHPEVVLLDIGMPDVDGYEVARYVRRGTLGRAVTLVAVTGWGHDADKARALAAGFNHHFTKPVNPEQLRQLLNAKHVPAEDWKG
jgi:CheY-like chemotaxis protein